MPRITRAELRGQPAYKRDPRSIIGWRLCGHCEKRFPLHRKFKDARFCSRKCGMRATLPPDHNAIVARASAKKRGDLQRGRGNGKSYPKLYGRHAHRVVAEQKIGRPLRKGEIVHHEDENRLNYSAENLSVLPNQSVHVRLHGFGRRKGGPLT